MSKFNREDKIRKDVTDFYNNVASQFSQTRKNWWNSLSFVKKYIHNNDNLLDFGCGNGRLLEFIYNENLRINYFGLDVSQKLVDIAKSRYKSEKFSVIKNERETYFEDEKFDIIISISVFHHFTPQMAEKTLQEMRRILKKDGAVVITAWHLWNKKRMVYLLKSLWKGLWRLDFSRVAQLPFSYSNKKEGQITHWRTCYWWSRKKLEKIAEKNNFKVLESGYSRDNRNNKRNIYMVLKK